MVTTAKDDKPEEEQSKKNQADPDEVPGPENKDSQNSVAERDHKKNFKPERGEKKTRPQSFPKKRKREE